MPAKKETKTKEAKAKAAMQSSKGKKKKWSKGKVKDKLNNAAMWTEESAKKLKTSASLRVITTAVLSERLKINGSLAREALRAMAKEGSIRKVCHGIYTRKIISDE